MSGRFLEQIYYTLYILYNVQILKKPDIYFASIPAVAGSIFIWRFRLFLGQCGRCKYSQAMFPSCILKKGMCPQGYMDIMYSVIINNIFHSFINNYFYVIYLEIENNLKRLLLGFCDFTYTSTFHM